ncbi:MAG: SH3 domain-containing protein [Defluviitaleaceae bacterium]|nr:SH3 domain-containing protein [Defluviitaleaceae bacterium]
MKTLSEKISKPIAFGLLFGLAVVINASTVYACEACPPIEYSTEACTLESENTNTEKWFAIEKVISEKETIANGYNNYNGTENLTIEDIIAEENAVEENITEEAIEEDTTEETPEPTYFRTTANLRLRTGPSTYHDEIRTVSIGSTVRVYDQRDGEWFSVYQAGSTGYMYAEFLTPIPAGGATSANNPQTPQVNTSGVEVVSWWEARNNIIRTGVPLHVTDVRTGITFWLQSFSNGSHADVVPRYREDTEAVRRAFGGRWSWEPRPILVTVDGRTFAASMSGMPHGGFNSRDNGITGHFCMHFLESRTHNGNRSHERDHQNAVQEAFRAQR